MTVTVDSGPRITTTRHATPQLLPSPAQESNWPEGRPRSIVDLFAGPGGLDVAAAWLGVPASGIELNDNACLTRTAAELVTKPGDVRGYVPAGFPEASVLAGGPPCQTYTVAGAGEGRRALDDVLRLAGDMADGKELPRKPADFDERTGLVLEPLWWALEAFDAGKPYEAIVLEQVPAVFPVWQAVGKALMKRGYEVAHDVLHTEEFGVPQTRRRAVLIARLNGHAALPEPTHRRFRKGVDRAEGNQDLDPWVTMHDVLDRSESFEVVSNYGTGGNPRARGRRRSDEPAFTVTGKVSRNRVVTPEGNSLHRFTDAEAGQLQTFPADYPWRGKDISQQIGNAVPPLLAFHILGTALGMDPRARIKSIPKTWKEVEPKPLAEEAAKGAAREG